MEFCHKVIPTRSQYADVAEHKCHCPKGHSGKCEEFPFLNHLKSINKQVAEKIKRDATMTTGAAWKSADAGPNRILRWVMLLDDEELLKYGINMAELKPGVIAKLREKAADYAFDQFFWSKKLSLIPPDSRPNYSLESIPYDMGRRIK